MKDRSFLGTGWAFPVELDTKTGTAKEASEEEAVRRSVEVILGTAKGDRAMRPDFGSDLINFLFRPINTTNKGRIASAVKEALMRWEPRIKVLDVRVEVDRNHPATVLINIAYEIRSSSTRANLVYPFYLGGSES
jgi:hypothetical protein